MSARSKLLATSLTAVLLLGGTVTACGDDGEGGEGGGEGDMGDMEMPEEE